MRRLRFYIIILLTVVWFLIILPYFIVQTSFGAKIVSQQLSKLSSYSISIGSIHHSFSHFSELIFDDLVISDNKQEIAKIKKLVIGIDKNNLWQLKHFNYITVIDGVINDTKFNHHDISADTLKLIDTTVNISINDGQDKLSFQQINGGIKPFALSGKDKYQFDLTSQQVLFNQLVMKSVLIQGFHRDGIISVTNLGGSVNNGFFVSKLKILPDESFDIEQLKVNNIHIESTNDDYINQLSTALPKLNIRQFSMFESSIRFPSLSFEKGNIEATNLSYDKQWHFNDGVFVFNADAVVCYDELFSSILINLKSNDQEIKIEKAIATWNKGNVNVTGSWQNNQLRLNQLILAGVDYQLPEQFKQPILPDVFSKIEIEQLSILPSILINTNSDYPFVFANFEVSGSNITVAQDKKLGLYSGTLFFKAERGSVNSIDINYPDLVVKFDPDNRAILDFSTLIKTGGMVESAATINPSQTEFSSLKVNAYNVTSLLLEEWKLVKQPPKALNFTADLHGDISPFSLSGTISSDGNDFVVETQP